MKKLVLIAAILAATSSAFASSQMPPPCLYKLDAAANKAFGEKVRILKVTDSAVSVGSRTSKSRLVMFEMDIEKQDGSLAFLHVEFRFTNGKCTLIGYDTGDAEDAQGGVSYE